MFVCYTMEISCVLAIRRFFRKIPWANVRKRHVKHHSIWILWKCFGFRHVAVRVCAYVLVYVCTPRKQYADDDSTPIFVQITCDCAIFRCVRLNVASLYRRLCSPISIKIQHKIYGPYVFSLFIQRTQNETIGNFRLGPSTSIKMKTKMIKC